MIIPMITTAIVLGRAFDYNMMSDKNVQIFDSNSIKENLESIQRAQTSAHYRLMEYSSEVNDFLDIDGELSLKVKKGQFGIEGFGDYMRKKIDRQKTVEVLITVYHETVTETFPSYTELRHNWQNLSSDKVGTHYIRSITYGGQLLISYLLKANSTEYMEEIKAAVTANLAISGSFDGSIKGNIDKLNKEISGISTTEIHAYATAGAISPVTTLEQAFQLADKYPSLVADINGKRSPLKLEIISLNTLAPNHKEYRKNLALDAMLSEATNKYDDVDVSYEKFYSWAKSQTLDEKEQELVNDYYDNIIKARDAFNAAIRDLKGDGGLDQFDAAFKAYGEGADNIPNRFARDLLKLQSTIEKRDFIWYPYTKAVSQYIHWGSVNCTLPSPQPLYIGLAATAPESGLGNGGTIECLSALPKTEVEEKKLTVGTTISVMNGMTYRLPDDSTGPVLCSSCLLENATSIVTIPGRTSCPEETKLEYSGYLMTSRNAGPTSHYVCMDRNPDTSFPDIVIKTDEDAATLEPVWMKCADCEEDEKNKYVPCAVCSR